MKSGEVRVVNDEAGILAGLKGIRYAVPEGASRVPWLETLDITVDQRIPDDFPVENNIERENLLHDITLQGVREGLGKMAYLGVKFARPNDFMAEMVKDDKQMKKVMRGLERSR
ncbi:eukaryotic rRNA processing protein EBP2 [Gregarina niphandrodes]|uniref:Eukaryotic rRNA processing protein EBP2 n=1 Tax=Gregarina niphandrodes TaxID=110365 RepID=A0A023AYR1_GRENI|nr:eukaryotic rRNA processing protein EBP2 [Gregarina niphandrodes]EZG43807.1 eukaryotic rRNA processing protein EBP2 [Gregarina niphandrodes]|eukprot:XP_011133017.1 eukaryotic rRNA processing protein EBP2 [Gregarina niphandrodes]